MTQFWSPSRELTPTLTPGVWLMADKSRRIGFIRKEARARFVCETAEYDQAQRVPLGSAPTLQLAAKRLWEWGRSAGFGWRPMSTLVEAEPGVWVMPPRPGYVYPQGYIERETRGGEERFAASTWGMPERPAERIGVYPTMDAAAVAVWLCPVMA